MRKLIASMAAVILSVTALSAARAYPGHRTVLQPDGSELTIMGHGDEFSHHVATVDGYTVVKGTDGFYRYAESDGFALKPSDVVAHDLTGRSSVESSYLRSLPRHLSNPVSATGMRLQRLSSRTDSYLFPEIGMGRAFGWGPKRAAHAPGQYRGLVILVNFSDMKFSRGDKAHSLVDGMMNGTGRTSYADPRLGYRVPCTGSVRDYFADNSGGQFVPEFDVVGPVEIPESQYYIDCTENTYDLCAKVLQAVDPDVDFSRYDCDGNGEVDMVYILYAGYSSVYQGNDERLVWPHAGHFADCDSQLVVDGVSIGRFACSSELYGWTDEQVNYLDGIGVIVHEFSHVLGFKDHYDVSGYLNEDPGTWDVMASGNYNGVLNDTPCGYSSYERFAAGFISPRTIDAGDEGETVSLRALSSYGDACRIVSLQDSTVFMLENRQPEKWDRGLPGHGMLVWRVDSCDAHYWEHNALNVNNRLHLKLVRANGPTLNIFREMDDTDYDPFPGSRNVTALSNYTRESDLLTDLRYPSPIGLYDITETDGIVDFCIEADTYADARPYTFSLADTYKAHGILVDDGEEREMEWTVSTKTVSAGGSERHVMCDIVPDTRRISASDPKYADGLSAAYLTGTDRRSLSIEPSRVAVHDDKSVWLVDFTDLDHGGSGAIRLDMDPYGNLSLSDPESVIGYCYLPRTSVVVDGIAVLERFSMIRDLGFTADSDTSVPVTVIRPEGKAYDLLGLPVDRPEKGGLYIIGGKPLIWR